jgi:hypothetical protein
VLGSHHYVQLAESEILQKERKFFKYHLKYRIQRSELRQGQRELVCFIVEFYFTHTVCMYI